MGFDLYVGTLTRFYASDWETQLQVAARHVGVPVIRRPPTGSDPVPNAREVQQLIESWQQELSATVQQVQCIDEPITWSEAATEPYFTIPLEVERYAALVLLAAYTELPKSKFRWSSKLPTELHRDWFNDAQLRRALESDTPRTFSHLYRPDLWLPVPLRIPVKTPGPTGQTIICGSSQILQQQLNDLASAASPTFDRQLTTENALVGYARSGLQLLRTWLASRYSTGYPCSSTHRLLGLIEVPDLRHVGQ